MTVADEPSTGRSRPVTLTEYGRSQLNRADATVMDIDTRMTGDLDSADLRRLGALLTACIENLA